MQNEFHWRHARDSLITEAAIKMFQIVSSHEGDDFDAVKNLIDSEYQTATGSTAGAKHGGLIQTWIQAFREAGWVTFETSGGNNKIIRLTPSGKQALLLLGKLPDFLKAVPYFVISILTRFQINNPSRPESRNSEYDEQLKSSDIFPYWTLFKIMRESDSRITTEELRRFVFRIKNASEIPSAIAQIKAYRADKADGVAEPALDQKYPKELDGAIGEPKYIMGRLGTQVGNTPAVVEKEGPSTWKLNENYIPFIDGILASAPAYQENLTEESWMSHYGQLVPLDSYGQTGEPTQEDIPEVLENDLPDDDPIWKLVKNLVDSGSPGVVLSGPPGTSKTWYAHKIAAKLADGDGKRVAFVQFHPAYTYDDFVEGYVPTGDEKKPFEAIAKGFMRFCDVARKNADVIHVMVIDELNRGDPSKIFGELLTYIERGYRNRNFSLTYSGRKTSIPSNVFMLATMNPYDKSVTDLDDALDRRLDRVALDPSIELLRDLLHANGFSGEIIGKVIDFFKLTNSKSRHGIGHAFFANIKDEAGLKRLWNHKLRFVLEKGFRFEPDVYSQLKASYVAIFADGSDLS